MYLAEHIQNGLMKALENDSDWVEIYHATSQLLVDPKALPEGEPLSDITGMVIEVWLVSTIGWLSKLNHSFLRQSLRENKLTPNEDFWKDVVIPVDLPFKNVGTVFFNY